MQHIASLHPCKPSAPNQCTTTVNTRTFSLNCTVATRLPPRAASPSCVTSRQLVSTNNSCTKGADVALPECLVATSSCNPSLASRKREHVRNLAIGPALLTPKSADSEEDDLAAMVHDYMENGINDFHCHEKNDGVGASASTDLRHYETLQSLFLSSNTPLEEELLSVVNAIVLSMKDKDLAYFARSPSCRGRCIRRLLVKHLQLLEYDAAVCSSKWPAFGKVPGGEYEYVDVILEKGLRHRLIVDVDFQSHFEIARPTQSYLAALRTLPVLFVGSVEKLSQILQALAEAAKLSMRQNAMPVPPWRTLSYMTSKWLSPFERHVQNIGDKGSNSFNAGKGDAHASSTDQCIQQLHHLKTCLLSSGLLK